MTPRGPAPVTPAPTATPFLHTITNDDTLLGIAFKYGISLEQLEAANPGVDPHFLTVGKTLVIPIEGEDPAFQATPTPVGVNTASPTCYPTAEGGAWCFLLVNNPMPQAVENLSALISLYSRTGEPLVAKEAIAPLNRLASDAAIPLAAYFEPPLPGEFIAQAQLLSAITIADSDNRYLPASAQMEVQEISPDGLQAHLEGTIITGTFETTATQHLPQVAWAAAVAYDSAGNVVGMRKWEASQAEACAIAAPAETPTGPPNQTATPRVGLAAKCLRFSLDVYSLGPPIDRVEVLVEVR
jgi:LysM repeat protein